MRNELDCVAPNLAPGASESVTFTVQAPNSATPGETGLQFGIAFADQFGEFGEFVEGTTPFFPVTVASEPTDLQVTGSSNNGSPPVGSQFTYTFQVKNSGSGGASDVTFDDTLPAGVKLAANGAAFFGHFGCNYEVASNSVHCDIGALEVGQQAVISVPAIATATGAFAKTATVGMSGTDTQPANNSVTVTVQPR